MKIALIARSTLYKVLGGDTIQILETASHLRNLGLSVSVFLTNEKINYPQFDLLHFFNITRPADIYFHIKKSGKPIVISPILFDHSAYDKQHRKGISGILFKHFSSSNNEYLKTIFRWLLRKDTLRSKSYIWKGQEPMIREILQKTNMLLPGSVSEFEDIRKKYSYKNPYLVVPCGIDTSLFKPNKNAEKNPNLVLCAARIEGIKNQLHLIQALNNTSYHLLLIGDPAPNQLSYYRKCKKIAAGNIEFKNKISQSELVSYYQQAKVHVLASWFESCGLSSLEAAAMGCNVVITGNGYARDYFGEHAFYCDPGNINSIRAAIKMAAKSKASEILQKKIPEEYTWQKAACLTFEAYKQVILQ
jgi:glycosyltransferase involved in cell wall biosynthesis